MSSLPVAQRSGRVAPVYVVCLLGCVVVRCSCSLGLCASQSLSHQPARHTHAMDTPGEHDSANTHSASTPAAATAVTAAASASASAPAAPAAPAFAHRWAWGSNGSGVLGLGHTEDLFTPTQAPLIRAQISAAGTAGAGAAPDSADSATVQLPATPTSAIPPALSIVVRFTRMSCGGCHTLAVDGECSWSVGWAVRCSEAIDSPLTLV